MAKKTIATWGYTLGSSVLLIAGLTLILYQPVVNYVISPKQLEKVYETGLDAEGIKQNIDSLAKQSQDQIDRSFQFAQVENLDVLEVRPSIQTANVIGGIYIPSAGINLPILYGATNDNLRVASATLNPDQIMGTGNYAIAGHNSRNPNVLFASLRKVQVGEALYISDKDKVYKYTAVDAQVVMPERVDVLDDVEDKALLTLISCYSRDGSDRLVVTGELTEVIDYAEVESDIYDAFKPL
jgi:sortase A